jgi:membrane-bound lytic murein transglycosylase A
MFKSSFFSTIIILIMSVMGGCSVLMERKPTAPGPPLVLIDAKHAPIFLDDFDYEFLEPAIAGSLSYYRRLAETDVFLFGDSSYTVQELKESLMMLMEIKKSAMTDDAKQRRIVDAFDIYQAAGSDDQGTVLFTGYYEPILEGSLVRTDTYRYPVYRTPDDLIVISSETCTPPRNTCEKRIYRLGQGNMIPYYSRKDIDTLGVLHEKNLEIAWLSDPVERFYLHIQGSGKIRLADGSHIRIGYAQSNGRPYHSIGRYLLENGKISQYDLSHQSIKTYLRNHPDELEDIFNYNERYIFFRYVDDVPIGSLGVIVQPGRSIATDPRIFPRGALAFMQLKKPVFDANQDIVEWLPLSRFILNQDEGSAIKGPGRVDIFCGSGDKAELLAGSLKEKGKLYFLVKKKKER